MNPAAPSIIHRFAEVKNRSCVSLLLQEERPAAQLFQRRAADPFLLLLRQDFSGEDWKAEFNVDAPSGVVMEGYLFKRASNAFKTWNR